MQINVIIGATHVYATYFKTICFKAPFTNEIEKMQAQHDASASAFNYSLNSPVVRTSLIADGRIKSDENVFDYLEKSHSGK